MIKITRARVALVAVLGLALFVFGVWVLLHPASIWVQPWRATVSEVRNDVIFGPYPTEDDFQVLKERGVTTIVSLLNPAVPYEKVLLAQERERAARFGMDIQNFPMGSILGQKFGDDYHANSRAAAEAALSARGTAYIHCYLGINRAKNVQKYLDTLATSANYAGVEGSLEDVDAHGRARRAYKERRSEDVVREVAGMQAPSVQALRMAAWSHFRMGQVLEARARFGQLLAQVPDDNDAATGLGYCALREGELAGAEAHFATVLARTSDDIAAIEGMGYARMRQGDREQARALFQQALAANPDNPETRAVLAQLDADGETVAEAL
ncbi:MAG TPA: tetratricopeptide repeat protein [Lysobacter sp.]|nr:tetratricopeptide repeat protein [Lysobacter sp.]